MPASPVVVVRVRFSSKSIKSELDESIKQKRQRLRELVTASTEEFAEDVISAGRADIAAAGNFGGKWISGFTYEPSEKGGEIKGVVFRHSNPLWRVFQSGAFIKGKPLLWIPIEKGGPPAREFGGRLFQVKRTRKRDVPLLMSAEDRQVKYIGVKQVRIRRKFHLLKIIRDEAKKWRQSIRDGMGKT